MKVSKSSIQSLKPKLKFNHLSSEKRQVEDVGPMASLLKTRSVVRFSGPDTMKFLQGLLTNDTRKFSEPTGDEKSSVRSLYAAMLTPQGRFLYDLFLYEPPPRTEQDDVELLADVDSSVLEELVETLKKYRLRSKVDIENVGGDFSCWQRYGYGVHHHKRQPSSSSSQTGWQWHKDPRLDCLGFRGIFPSNTIPPMVEADTQTEEENYLMWRLEKGVAEGSIEIPKGEAIPLEYNLAGLNAISFQKGCYIGQELIARSHHHGVIRKRLIPLNFLDSESGKEVSSHKVAPSSEVIVAGKSGKKAGMVSTALGSRGLGLLRIEEAFKGTANLVIKGEEDVKVEAVRPHWWPRDWFLEHEPHQAAR